ncbi:MAG: dihydrolipoamide acetyltransferase family protein [Paracoccus sp. (in: a-proteobacteria)]|uniref:dihydrolipoamide acetyltransferase family protein n=1 Tax=Paracoccus sp. TaxID=267 RepID=UPI0026DFAADC|nr:dihydrolipoamide acetyltransferase family protein [Paracoccus sp. (in: a-proteobacteria)]MDO5631299.1 dihydrolipoamide acetyltransferase family protein [Paracoccus sp. (in: a-proteobacteria)]
MGEHVIRLPDIGDGITEAEIAEWLVEVGDKVTADEPVCALMTDKVTIEIPAPVSGRVLWLGGAPGDMMRVGSDLIRLTVEGTGNIQIHEPEVPPPPRAGVPAESASAPTQAKAKDASTSDPVVDLLGVTEDIPVIGLRRQIAERMQETKRHVPHFTIVEEVDVTALEELRAKLNAEGNDVHLTLLPFVIRAMARALREQPDLNAHHDDAAGVLRRVAALHVGIATQTPHGPMVPVIRDAGAQPLHVLAAELLRLASAARDGTIRRDEMTGSTITISSLGSLGAISTTPIINRPEVAIVGVNRIATRPLWDGQGFVPRKVMNLSCSFDHRVIDGWDGAVFVARLKELLETPALIFVDG